ncbi:peptidoglycan-binding protein (plasmid) [Clostridium baratii]|uniref:peptidoglycan-binding protein n=1 Tax=Clostridium baratii TaxID=1561 RepID=UPI0030CA735C
MLLKIGSKGEDVVTLQMTLKLRGYDIGPSGADGIFGQGTYNAVKKFQADHNLGADGIVGPATQEALHHDYSGNTDYGELIKMGSSGPQVAEIQRLLIKAGYEVGSSGADGMFGQGTYNAVKRFQADHNLGVDGIVGSATKKALKNAGSGRSERLLRLGSQGEDVRTLQMTLKLRGYDIGPSGADGIFGQGTYNAVKKFQADHNLGADGIVGPATQEALHHDYSGNTDYGELIKMGSSGPQVAEIQRLLIKAGYEVGSSGADGMFGQGTYNAVKRFQADHNLGVDGIVGSATKKALKNAGSGRSERLLRLGSQGEDVRTLQMTLKLRGYDIGPSGADGIFGQGTYNAVKKFQADHNLGADGIVGPATQEALHHDYSGNTDYGELIKMGSSGPQVAEIQRLLIKAGYGVGSSGVDGMFGQGTYNAVKRFQADHNLGADGIVGPATKSALYCTEGATTHVSGGPGVSKFVKVAQAQEFHERIVTSDGEGDNMTPYGAWFGMNGVPWCAIFVSWCANQAGILGSIVPRYSYCADAVNWYRSKGRYRTRQSGYTPKAGDVIFFYDASKEAPFCHTGIVTGYENGEVITTEGNKDQAVRHNLRYSHDYWKIHGYGDNGGIKYTQKEIGEAISKVGFAKILGVTLTGETNEVHLTRGALNITLKTALNATFGNPDGKINISKDGIEVEVTNNNCGLSTKCIKDNINRLLEKGVGFSKTEEILKGATIKFKVDSINPLKLVLEMETKILEDKLTVSQSIEVEFTNNNFNESDFKSDMMTELYGLLGTIATGFSSIISSVSSFFESLGPFSPIEIIKALFEFIKSIPIIPI